MQLNFYMATDKLLETKKMGKVQGTWVPIPVGSYALLVTISTCLCTFLVLYFWVLIIHGVHLFFKVTNGIFANIFGMLHCNKNNGTNCWCKCFKDDITLHARICQGSHWSPYGLPREKFYSSTLVGSLESYQNDVCTYHSKSLGEGIVLSKEYS
jgi:hypothetical protein